MDTKVLNQQSQHWEKNFSSKPEMFGLEPSLPAKKSLELFKESKISKIVELGAGLGRDTIFFAKNSIHVTAVDYSSSGLKVINDKTQKQNLSNLISTKLFDVRKKLPFEDNSIEACFSHMLYCMALTTEELKYLNNEICRVLKPNGKLIINTPLMPMLKKDINTHYNRDIFDINSGIQNLILKTVRDNYVRS